MITPPEASIVNFFDIQDHWVRQPRRAQTALLGLRCISMGKARTHVVFSLAILLACCACSFALDPSLDVSQYAHTVWKVRDGFAKGVINALAQTPDGYLWVGTESGLLRFDGVHPVLWQPPSGQQLPGTIITSLLVTQDGTLWIGTFTGLASWKGGRLTQFPDLRGHDVTSLLQARDGTVWIGVYLESGGGVCEIKSGVIHCERDSRFGNGVMALYEDHKGSLWLGTHNGLWRWKPGTANFFPIPEDNFGVTSFAEDEQGQLLFGSYAGIRRLVDGRVEPYPSSVPAYGWHVMRMLRDHDGGLWVATSEHGLAHVKKEGGTDRFSSTDGLSGDSVLRLLEDQEGDIWVATFDGIDRFREYAVSTISTKQGLSSANAVSVLPARDGTLWISTMGGLNHRKDGKIFIVGSRGGVVSSDAKLEGDPPIGPLFEDGGGRIFVSTGNRLGYLQNGRYMPLAGIPARSIPRAMSEGRPGDLWVSTQRAGLLHVFQGHLLQQIPWSGLGRTDFAPVITTDPSWRGLWVGFHQGGVAYIQDGAIRNFYSGEDGLGKGTVTDLRFGADGALWAATDGGLSRIKDGHVTTLSAQNGLPCEKVVAAIEDNDHSMWLNLACGLVRIRQVEIDAWVADPSRILKTTIFDASDGVRGHAEGGGFQPLMTKSADGRIWFLPWDGVSVIDPHHLPFNKIPPPVHIEKVTADDKTYDMASGVQLPSGVRNLTIDYTALSLVVPEKVHFRYKLEGQDKDWREVVNDREVQYTNLPPKHYKFRVLACNNSGVWNEEGASLDFVIPPAWYQTNWFRAACIAAFLAMIWGIYELRVRQLAAQFNMRLEERVSERTRIARDLHDTLLQSFQGLVFRFQAARYQLPDRPEQASEALDSALVSADQAIAEGRSAIQELRSGSSQESNLEQMLLALGRELAASHKDGDSAPSLRVIVEGNRRAKRAMIKEEVYRIARELLRNAYRHAQPRNIEAELRYDDAAFLLVVRDDGKGIDSNVLKGHGRAGHWGLPGMYERAEGMGARLDIWSEAGAGTEVRLTVPAAIAYEKSGDSGRFKLFGKTRIYEHRS